MQVKIHKSYRDVVAICDTDLIGKKLEKENFQLEVKESFYKGDEVSEEELLNLMKNFSIEDATFNIVGKQATEAAEKAGIISEEHIKEIKGVPFALILA